MEYNTLGNQVLQNHIRKPSNPVSRRGQTFEMKWRWSSLEIHMGVAAAGVLDRSGAEVAVSTDKPVFILTQRASVRVSQVSRGSGEVRVHAPEGSVKCWRRSGCFRFRCGRPQALRRLCQQGAPSRPRGTSTRTWSPYP